MHIGHVTKKDGHAVDRLDWHIAQLFDRRGCIVQLNGVFKTADLLGSDGNDQVLIGQRIGHVLTGQSARLHGWQVQVDLHEALFPTIGPGDGRAGHRHQRRTHRIHPEVKQVLFG